MLQRPAADHEVDELVTTYLAEWNTGVHPIDGVAALLANLAHNSRLAVVTNTHHPGLVPDHLAAKGVSEHIEAVITSVEVGWCKPHAAIYTAALDMMGVGASSATFVGDSLMPDYDGPRKMGMHALLIDPLRQHEIPAEHLLDSILDVRSALSRRA